jgi:hypothetical protein
MRKVNSYLQSKVGVSISPALMDFHEQVLRDKEQDGGGSKEKNSQSIHHVPDIKQQQQQNYYSSQHNTITSGSYPVIHRMNSNNYSSHHHQEHHTPQLSMVRLLALVRKQGMDLLFPQYVHDKVLACIFVAIRCHGPLG